jgi:hypothetical protein
VTTLCHLWFVDKYCPPICSWYYNRFSTGRRRLIAEWIVLYDHYWRFIPTLLGINPFKTCLLLLKYAILILVIYDAALCPSQMSAKIWPYQALSYLSTHTRTISTLVLIEWLLHLWYLSQRQLKEVLLCKHIRVIINLRLRLLYLLLCLVLLLLLRLVIHHLSCKLFLYVFLILGLQVGSIIFF